MGIFSSKQFNGVNMSRDVKQHPKALAAAEKVMAHKKEKAFRRSWLVVL